MKKKNNHKKKLSPKPLLKPQETQQPQPVQQQIQPQPQTNLTGRPHEYEKKVKPFFEKIEYWVSLGLTNSELAENLNISESTFYQYLRDFTEFSHIVNESKVYANEKVVAALYKRTVGEVIEDYEEIEETYFIKNKMTGLEEPVLDDYGNPIFKKKKRKSSKTIIGDTKAQEFWLKNRDPKNWKLGGSGGGGANINIDNKNNNLNQNANSNKNLNHLSIEETKEKLLRFYEIRTNNDRQIPE